MSQYVNQNLGIEFGEVPAGRRGSVYNQNTMAKFFGKLWQKNKSPDSQASVLGVGSVINGRYRLDEEIGRGGMGIVYRAYDIANEREVAVKVINAEKANALTHNQFAQEAAISARFHHPHIVEVFETGTVNGNPEQPYIVMELVKGISLLDLPNLTFARILAIGEQICEALEYTHSLGFVYRDLKPGNVLVERRGFHYFIKLMDFGLARRRGTENLPDESQVAGTLFYLAPELIAGQPADIPSDLYALGATLYEMITGHVPFSDFDEETILAQHLQAKVKPPSQSRSHVPPALEEIVLRLLQKNPNDRFASAGEVRQALEQVPLAKDIVRGNLPTSALNSAGEDAAQIIPFLESHPLVTVLGDDDAFALAAATKVVDQFSDGAWWVDLRSVTEPALVPETVASTLGICSEPDRSLTVSLVEGLREKNLLLVLIHCDGMRYACAQLAETLLRTCPDVRILATSREALKVEGEKVFNR